MFKGFLAAALFTAVLACGGEPLPDPKPCSWILMNGNWGREVICDGDVAWLTKRDVIESPGAVRSPPVTVVDSPMYLSVVTRGSPDFSVVWLDIDGNTVSQADAEPQPRSGSYQRLSSTYAFPTPAGAATMYFTCSAGPLTEAWLESARLSLQP